MDSKFSNCRDICSRIKAATPDRAFDVYIQDQNTNPIFMYFKEITSEFSIANNIYRNTYTFEASAGHGISLNNRINIIENPNFYSGIVTNVNVNTITVDTPFPIIFSNNANGYIININMAINGSSTRRIFSVSPLPNQDIDITKATVHILGSGATAMDDAKFGNITALTKGIVFRKRINLNNYYNYGNLKTNRDISMISYHARYSSKAPAGYYGFCSLISIAGQDNLGVTLRLLNGSTNQRLELIIQDDLSDLEEFFILVEGHVVQ